MNKTDFDLKYYNEDLRNALKGQTVDFGAFLAGSYSGTVSVTARYCPASGSKRYVTLDGRLKVVEAEDPDEWYYGVSPRFDNDMIIAAISSLRLNSPEGLDSFIAEHSGLFMLHADQSEYLPDMARYIVLAAASNFGIRLKLTDEEDARLRGADEHIQTYISRSDGITALHGCPAPELLDALRTLRFSLDEEGLWRTDADGIGIEQIYADPKNIALIRGNVFYSGVLLKPVRIEILKNRYENSFVDSIIIHFERSTYATVYALDNNFTGHALLRGSGIIGLLRKDDRAKREMINSIEAGEYSDPAELLRVVNRYLETCFNVNQVGVSANIITADGFLLLGHRAQKTIDKGSLYPGVNGNAEVADKNVSFYSVSAYEDYPAIDLEQKRMDFLGEIGREAYAELKLDLPNQEWHCYGLMISGTRPPEESGGAYGCASRRMHFNILFEQRVSKSYLNLEEESKTAVEAFESDRLLGLALKCYINRISMVFHNIVDFLEEMVTQKEVIESLLVLILFFSNLMNQKKEEKGLLDAITLLFSAIILFSTVKNVALKIYRKTKANRQIRRITIYKNMSRDKLTASLHSFVAHHSFHPAAYSCLRSFVEHRLYNDYFNK